MITVINDDGEMKIGYHSHVFILKPPDRLELPELPEATVVELVTFFTDFGLPKLLA